MHPGVKQIEITVDGVAYNSTMAVQIKKLAHHNMIRRIKVNGKKSTTYELYPMEK